MRTIKYTNRFKRDYRREKSGRHGRSLDADLVAAVGRETRFVLGLVATELPPNWAFRSYDLVVSSIPDLVDRFRQENADA